MPRKPRPLPVEGITLVSPSVFDDALKLAGIDPETGKSDRYRRKEIKAPRHERGDAVASAKKS